MLIDTLWGALFIKDYGEELEVIAGNNLLLFLSVELPFSETFQWDFQILKRFGRSSNEVSKTGKSSKRVSYDGAWLVYFSANIKAAIQLGEKNLLKANN